MKSFLVKWKWAESEETTTIVDIPNNFLVEFEQSSGVRKMSFIKKTIREGILPPEVVNIQGEIDKVKIEKHKVVKAQRYEDAQALRNRERLLHTDLSNAMKDWQENNNLSGAENIIITEIYTF